MLTYAELVSLSNSLRDTRVLSVYIDGRAYDPALQRVWRIQLDHSLKDLRNWLAESSRKEQTQFERCVALLEKQIAPFSGAIGAPGWAAFITPEGVRDAEALPVPMPTIAVWSTGICVAPYVRALKQTRPVVITVADARKAEIYTYRVGQLTTAETIRAHAHEEPPLHMGDAARLGFHGGVRGATGREAAQQAHLEGTHRMLTEVAHRAVELAGADGWIVTGGIPEVSGQATHLIHALAPGRVLQLESLDVHATRAEIAAAAQRAASSLRDRWDMDRVDDILSHDERDGIVTLGPAETDRALEQARVRELYLTPRYVDDHAADAEEVVRAALGQGALVEEVSRTVASRLDEYGGVAARLRYRLHEAEVVAP